MLQYLEYLKLQYPERRSSDSCSLVQADARKSFIVQEIKNAITELIHFTEEKPEVNYSKYLSTKLNYDYTYLSNLFSEDQQLTIQQFIIINKIERAKILMLHHNYTLTQISYKLHYSSVAHLSRQFKKVTGVTPSYFKQTSGNAVV